MPEKAECHHLTSVQEWRQERSQTSLQTVYDNTEKQDQLNTE